MIVYYTLCSGVLTPFSHIDTDDISSLIWVDLIDPDENEKKEIEKLLHLSIPTKEIEISNRLYFGDAIYMMAHLFSPILDAEEEEFLDYCTDFIIKNSRLVTIRDLNNPVLQQFHHYCLPPGSINDGIDIFLLLVKNMVNLLSDTLELISEKLDENSKAVFQTSSHEDLRETLRYIGKYGDMNAKLKENLLRLSRIFSYFILSAHLTKEQRETLRMYNKDVNSFTSHANYIAGRFNLILDATLGMINIAQNKIIKIFSVVAVVFLPPTLIASIYGMNFKYIPELLWDWGYPFALLLMLISGILPYALFKRNGWL